ncbi:MAG: alkaline phosphatase [Hyphomicrobium sp.]
MPRCAVVIAIFAALLPRTAQAQTIYPIDRAEILAGAKFDLKVEFPQAAENALKVTINGDDAERVTGARPELIRNEEEQMHSAYWLRNAEIGKAGRYEVTATTATNKTTVVWNVYDAPERKARNVILFVGDGLSVAHRTAARILSKGLSEGKYHGKLSIDDMPHMALVSTAGTDSVITDSANAMSAYTTGHKTCVNAIGVYCARNVNPASHPRVETLSTLAQRRHGMAVGVVTNSELTDATPAGMVAHTRRRNEMNDIVRMFYDVKPDVMLGGGGAYFVPKGPGSKRNDNQDYIAKFKSDGYTFASTAQTLKAAAAHSETLQLLGLFNAENIDGALDLKYLKKGSVGRYPDQPDLVDQTRAALSVLSRHPNGFLLMVESSRIDKYSHALDWERAVYDTIMLDNAVKAAKDFAADRNDTLIIVVPDHAHPVSLVGTFDDSRPGDTPRTKLGVYADAEFPNYPAPDAEGYPPTPDVSRRLAVMFGTYPDHCFSGKPDISGEFIAAKISTDGKTYVRNDEHCKPGTVRLFGNLPFDAPQGVHSGDDVILTAMGPGAEALHGQIDNTFVFRAIAGALGLAAVSRP